MGFNSGFKGLTFFFAVQTRRKDMQYISHTDLGGGGGGVASMITVFFITVSYLLR